MNIPGDSPSGLLRTALRDDPKYIVETRLVDALDAVCRLQARLVEEEHQLVFEMRDQGCSWQEIADAAGMASRQAAQRRYQRSAGLVDRIAATQARKAVDS